MTKDNSRDVAGPDWLRVGNTTLKDEEKSILYLLNAWLNDPIIDTAQRDFKTPSPPHNGVKANNLSTFKKH